MSQFDPVLQAIMLSSSAATHEHQLGISATERDFLAAVGLFSFVKEFLSIVAMTLVQVVAID